MDIQFEGIDAFSRPIFKAINNNNRYGSTNHLFDYNSSENEILKEINKYDLTYFGQSFGCEPWGTNPGDINIIKKEI